MTATQVSEPWFPYTLEHDDDQVELGKPTKIALVSGIIPPASHYDRPSGVSYVGKKFNARMTIARALTDKVFIVSEDGIFEYYVYVSAPPEGELLVSQDLHNVWAERICKELNGLFVMTPLHVIVLTNAIHRRALVNSLSIRTSYWSYEVVDDKEVKARSSVRSCNANR